MTQWIRKPAVWSVCVRVCMHVYVCTCVHENAEFGFREVWEGAEQQTSVHLQYGDLILQGGLGILQTPKVTNLMAPSSAANAKPSSEDP